MEFSRQEYWSGLSFPPPGALPNPKSEPTSLAVLGLAGRFFTIESPGKPLVSLKWSEVTQSRLTICDPMDTRLLCPWDSPSKNTGVGCHFLLQGIFLTQGSNLHLQHWHTDSLLLHHLGSPILYSRFILKYYIFPFKHWKHRRGFKRENIVFQYKSTI